MVKEFHGSDGSVKNRRFAIVVSRYHESITRKLLAGAIETLTRAGVPDDQVQVLWVPGAWELPFAAQRVLAHAGAQSPVDAIICLGCVIRGETTHDQHINTTVSNGLGRLGLDHKVPIAFGLLTVNTLDQAIQRAGGDVGNKGVESAEAVIEMVQLFDQWNSGGSD